MAKITSLSITGIHWVDKLIIQILQNIVCYYQVKSNQKFAHVTTEYNIKKNVTWLVR